MPARIAPIRFAGIDAVPVWQDQGGTAPLERKTKFIGVACACERVVASCTPLHIGKRTSTWQPRVTSEAAKNVALVTQTRMVL